ncbi:phage portal family protein [Methanobacterium paludis]|uniref:Phage portal protein, HK97 family n=1 Tax=Methanobacterium paludis (strain DSM 25820 / JCM 18151 / SWAN1) TaxID=868131 RepID=F6D2S4_METPW|nr:hypothetical protein [Methanobacterium paludis]AEG18653.1 hypothetical protein MSWAN_1642 [Methanobacterium paludis]
MTVNDNPPILADDRMDQILNLIQRYDPTFRFWDIIQLLDMPAANEWELILHYTRGGAGPFVDLQNYVDLGIGWTLKPKGFEDEEDGKAAQKLVEEDFRQRDFYTTMMQFGTYFRVLARSVIVKTYNGLGEFYSNPYAGVTGVDCINPMGLTDESIRNVMKDSTGTLKFQQLPIDGASGPSFSQDRVIYRTQNNLSTRAVLGHSAIQRSLTDLRTLARFPHYRNKLGHIYSQIMQSVKIDTAKMGESPLKSKIMNSWQEAKGLLNDSAKYYQKVAERGGTAAGYDWMDIEQSSFAGKEVKMVELEQQTLESIAFKFGVPLTLLAYAQSQVVNRATLEALTDVFISKQENGVRNSIYTPIIQNTAQEVLYQNDINEGHLEVSYNPFLSKDLLKAAQIVAAAWPTGAISRPEVRGELNLPAAVDLGGDEWKDMDPMPSPQAVTAATGEKVQLNVVKKVLAEYGLIAQINGGVQHARVPI